MVSTTSATGLTDSSPDQILTRNEIASWDDLSKLVAHFSRFNGHDWLFRGLTSTTHSLVPKVGRPERKRKPIASDPYRRIEYSLADEAATFNMFRDAARAHVTSLPTNELEWLALAQHYGVPTRLLDWTEGFLVATWFAVQKSGFIETFDPKKKAVTIQRHDAAIWVVRNLPAVSEDEKQKPFEVRELKCYRPPHISPRISAQRSVLTLQECPTKQITSNKLVKFTIRSKACFEIRKRLDACGVNENSLFPDLQGLGGHLAWRYKNNWLAGYRRTSGN